MNSYEVFLKSVLAWVQSIVRKILKPLFLFVKGILAIGLLGLGLLFFIPVIPTIYFFYHYLPEPYAFEISGFRGQSLPGD